MQKDASKLSHLPGANGLTEFLIPVLCTGTRYARVSAKDYAEAAEKAVEEVTKDNQYSEGRLQDLKALALPPELMLAPEQRATWPYWAYGWYGTDGVDWRQYRTDKGPAGIPDIAEESWPIPPYAD